MTDVRPVASLPADVRPLLVGTVLWATLMRAAGLNPGLPEMAQPKYLTAVVDSLGRVYLRRLRPLEDW